MSDDIPVQRGGHGAMPRDPATPKPPGSKIGGAYAGPLPSASAAVALAGEARLDGIEVSQVVQSLDNDVPLIADKPTIVRAYVDPTSFAADGVLTGELAVRRGAAGAGWTYVAALNLISVGPAAPAALQNRRHDITLSLNFRLPAAAVRSGPLTIRLNRLFTPGVGDVTTAAGRDAPDPTVREVNFVEAPVMRVRAIGLRYSTTTSPQRNFTPDAFHFNYLRSFLQRAYPIATLEWSQLVVDGDAFLPRQNGVFPPEQSDLVNAQLSAIRAREVTSGRDPRTRYYGLVDNGDGFMRGSAVYNRATHVFGTVACGPCGVPYPGFARWDTDATFADWYGAHEIGHTLQRRHPGFPTASQPRDPLETSWPYGDGLITTEGVHVGFDVGDPSLGLPMAALPGNQWSDVMTYADYQWLSPYTYAAILDQLIAEDAAVAALTS